MVQTTEVPAQSLRPGDVVLLRQGDVVPADGRLLEAHNLEADESSLTGESVTVDKQVASTPGAPLGDRSSMVYEGTIVSAGWGRAGSSRSPCPMGVRTLPAWWAPTPRPTSP
ncbi:MAG: hypothetical protein M0Z87_02075 [Actinomycetota bacterium]|nr:hypothetical protein [Actinomycetota bacterium]